MAGRARQRFDCNLLSLVPAALVLNPPALGLANVMFTCMPVNALHRAGDSVVSQLLFLRNNVLVWCPHVDALAMKPTRLHASDEDDANANA